MAARRSGLTEQDRAERAQYARHVTPFGGRSAPPLPPDATLARASPPLVSAPRTAPANSRASEAIVIGLQPAGVDNATWQRFRTGKFPAARTLDLHGRTAQRAFHALTHFLYSAQAERLRCVEIITGRGVATGRVLHRELPLWLNLIGAPADVLAAAHPHPANPGSVRILLRRVR